MPAQPASLENSILLFEQDGHLQANNKSQGVQLGVYLLLKELQAKKFCQSWIENNRWPLKDYK